VVGPLDRARQLEEVAGFVIAMAFAGVDPIRGPAPPVILVAADRRRGQTRVGSL
jgi:hypothetical protein